MVDGGRIIGCDDRALRASKLRVAQSSECHFLTRQSWNRSGYLHGNKYKGKLDQTVADGESRCCGPVLAACLIEDMCEVSGNRFFAQNQLLGDLYIRHASRYQAQYLHLSC